MTNLKLHTHETALCTGSVDLTHVNARPQHTKGAHSDDGDTAVDTCVDKSPRVADGYAVGDSSEQVCVEKVPVDDSGARLGRCTGTRFCTAPLACNLRLSLVRAGGDAGR